MKYRSKNGFTLAELLIVVAIIAVLVAVSIPIFNGQLEKARRAVDMQNARIIKSALTNAYNEGRMDIPKQAGRQRNFRKWCLGSNMSRTQVNCQMDILQTMFKWKKYLLWSKFRSFSKR